MEKHYQGIVLTSKVTELSKCEIFVFATDFQGSHTRSAARFACKKFGATQGKLGRQGQCYALPVDFNNIDAMLPYFEEFFEYVKSHPNNRFLITRMSYEKNDSNKKSIDRKDETMAQLFSEIAGLTNIAMPIEWLSVMIEKTLVPPKKEYECPEAIDEDVLKNLCKQYRYEIGTGMKTCVPSIRVRYVLEEGKFGYVMFGRFFFHNDDMYVFLPDEKNDKITDEERRESANIVMEVFNDECWNWGIARKVIFAGVKTPFKDTLGDWIYTGDVVKATKNNGGGLQAFPVSVNTVCGLYAFMLDNHYVALQECNQFERLGTVFYQLDKTEKPIKVNVRNANFRDEAYGGYRTSGNYDLAMTKIQFTPGFDQEDWKYAASKVLELEYNWRK